MDDVVVEGIIPGLYLSARYTKYVRRAAAARTLNLNLDYLSRRRRRRR